MSESSSGVGIGVGNIVALSISWLQWKSFGWMLIHGVLGWLYLIAWAAGCTESAPLQ